LHQRERRGFGPDLGLPAADAERAKASSSRACSSAVAPSSMETAAPSLPSNSIPRKGRIDQQNALAGVQDQHPSRIDSRMPQQIGSDFSSPRVATDTRQAIQRARKPAT